jgi:hypothetical protein
MILSHEPERAALEGYVKVALGELEDVPELEGEPPELLQYVYSQSYHHDLDLRGGLPGLPGDVEVHLPLPGGPDNPTAPPLEILEGRVHDVLVHKEQYTWGYHFLVDGPGWIRFRYEEQGGQIRDVRIWVDPARAPRGFPLPCSWADAAVHVRWQEAWEGGRYGEALVAGAERLAILDRRYPLLVRSWILTVLILALWVMVLLVALVRQGALPETVWARRWRPLVREFWIGVVWLVPTALAAAFGGGLAFAGAFLTLDGWVALQVLMVAIPVITLAVVVVAMRRFRGRGFYVRMQQDAGVPESGRPFWLSGFEVALVFAVALATGYFLLP